jgi:hypothetical protein
MSRSCFAAAAVLLAAAIGAISEPLSAAQPPRPPVVGWGQPLNLMGIGKAPETTPQGVGGFWADRLIADLDQMKMDVAGSRVSPVGRKALNEHIDVAIERTAATDKSLEQNKRENWYRASAEVEKALDELTKAAAVHAKTELTVLATLDRANYAGQQLSVAVTLGETNPEHLKRVIARLAAAQEEQGERLRFMAAETGPGGKLLEREVQQFVRSAQQFTKEAAGSANFEKLRKEVIGVAGQWMDVGAVVGKTPNLSPLIRYQVTRVDGLHRQILAVLGYNSTVPMLPLPRPEKLSVLAVGADSGMEPRVVVYADDKGTVAQSFYAYNRALHRSGVRVAVADLNGDGMPEVITINGGQGHARIKVFDGRDTNPILAFDGFEQKVTPWGYYIAAADLTKDGRALVAIAPDVGGPPIIEVYDLAQGKLLASIQAFPKTFEGGIRLAWGDVNGDGIPDLIAASGPGQMASKVKVFDGTNFTRVLTEFLGVDDKYKGGLFVAAADLTKNNRAEIAIGLDAGSRPLVRVFDGTKGKFIAEFEPYPNNFRGGVRVAIGDPDDDARLKIICSPGPGGQSVPIKLLRLDGKPHAELDPFPKSNKGMFIGSR